MKKNVIRNTILLSVAAIVLVVATVFTTLAYLTSSAAVANTFSVGDVAISMYETKVDETGKTLESGQKTSSGNHYLLVPGNTYIKDPTIYVNALSQKSYLFIKVRNDIAAIEEQHDINGATPDTIAKQLEKNGWKEHHKTATDIVYYYADATTGAVKYIGADGPTTVPVFESFTVEKDINQETLKLYNAARVSVTAYAIQDAAEFGTFGTAEALVKAWEAIVDTYDYVPDLSTTTTQPSTPAQQG